MRHVLSTPESFFEAFKAANAKYNNEGSQKLQIIFNNIGDWADPETEREDFTIEDLHMFINHIEMLQKFYNERTK